MRIEKREMYERIEEYRGREGWWLWRGVEARREVGGLRRRAGRRGGVGGGRNVDPGGGYHARKIFLKGKKGEEDGIDGSEPAEAFD